MPAIVEAVPAHASDPAAARALIARLGYTVTAPRRGGNTDSHESPRSGGYTDSRESGYWSDSKLVPQLAAADDASSGAAATASATDKA
jgi:hypothetical protein